MKQSVKYTFDNHFGEDGGDARARKSYNADEIDVLIEAAREEGRNDASTRATQAQARALGQLSEAVGAAIQAMDAEIEAMRAEAAHLAFAAAKKLAGAALDSAPEAEIAAALGSALHQAVGEARVVVKTAPSLIREIEARAPAIAAHEGYEGRIQFIGDAALTGADCRIEWRGGGIECAYAAIETALSDLIARRFPRASGNKE